MSFFFCLDAAWPLLKNGASHDGPIGMSTDVTLESCKLIQPRFHENRSSWLHYFMAGKFVSVSVCRGFVNDDTLHGSHSGA